MLKQLNITERFESDGSDAYLAGGKIDLEQIVAAYQAGQTAQQIKANLPMLTIDQIDAAIAYFLANESDFQAEIEDKAVAQERLAAELRRQLPSNFVVEKTAQGVRVKPITATVNGV